MESIIHELNVDGARLAREAAKRAEETDGRRRFVAGALGPTNRTASISPDVNNPGYRAVTFDEVEEAYVEQVRGLIDGGADLILIETIFDTLNAKAAIAAAWQVFDETRHPPADHDLGHDHRPLGPHPVGPDPDGLLALGAPCRSAHHRPQLRARRPRDARPHRRAVAASADTLVCAYPNAGLPNEFGGYDESPESMARAGRRVRRSRPRQHRRRLLRHDARPHPRHRRGGRRQSAAADPRDPAPDAALGPRALHADEGNPVRERRRAHQRHRLGPVPQADHRRRLRRRARRRPRPGRERRPDHRHQHGRGPDRLREGDGRVPQPRRRRARHRPGAA